METTRELGWDRAPDDLALWSAQWDRVADRLVAALPGVPREAIEHLIMVAYVCLGHGPDVTDDDVYAWVAHPPDTGQQERG